MAEGFNPGGIINPPDYRAMYERQKNVTDQQWMMICMLIERLGGQVTFKDSDFRDDIQNGKFHVDHKVDPTYNSRTYTVRRVVQ